MRGVRAVSGSGTEIVMAEACVLGHEMLVSTGVLQKVRGKMKLEISLGWVLAQWFRRWVGGLCPTSWFLAVMLSARSLLTPAPAPADPERQQVTAQEGRSLPPSGRPGLSSGSQLPPGPASADGGIWGNVGGIGDENSLALSVFLCLCLSSNFKKKRFF